MDTPEEFEGFDPYAEIVDPDGALRRPDRPLQDWDDMVKKAERYAHIENVQALAHRLLVALAPTGKTVQATVDKAFQLSEEYFRRCELMNEWEGDDE